jgi:hypothetical protein
VLALVFGAAALAADPPALGDKVVAFCEKHKGEQVGRGECADLAQLALRSAGAKGQGRDSPNPGDYTWGDVVFILEQGIFGPQAAGESKDLLPGDVVQFRDTKFEGKRPDGKGTYSMTFPHHTGVVAAVADNGKAVKIYHQNYAGKRVVMDTTLRLDDLKEGWIRVYRPVPAAGAK